MPKIEVKDLHFAYPGGQEVLTGLNLPFDDRSTAIIGQNGAGKTTFVKLLKGLLKPTQGDVWIKGFNTKEHTVAFLARHIGLVFQNPNDQIFKSRVLDEVMFGPINIGQAEQEARENAIKALDLVGLSDQTEVNPYDLSLSDRKLVSIAAVIAMNTDILIFDEPTIAQDFCGRERIKKIISQLKKEGKLIITIIHDMDFVAETFDRTIVLRQGTVLLDGEPREVFARERELQEAYLEQPHVTRLAQKLGIKDTLLTPDELIEYIKKRNA